MAQRRPQRLRVTHNGLMKRVNRKLAEDGKRIRKNRWVEYGGTRPEYVVIDEEGPGGAVYGTDDLEAYGRKLGVLADWEELAKERTSS